MVSDPTQSFAESYWNAVRHAGSQAFDGYGRDEPIPRKLNKGPICRSKWSCIRYRFHIQLKRAAFKFLPIVLAKVLEGRPAFANSTPNLGARN